MQEDEEKIREEKEMMNPIVSKNINTDDDIIKINLGYKVVIGANRSTLCLAEGSMFSNMF